MRARAARAIISTCEREFPVAGSLQRPGATQATGGPTGGRAGRWQQPASVSCAKAMQKSRRPDALLVELFGEVLLLPETLDQAELRLDPIEMRFLTPQDLLEEME